MTTTTPRPTARRQRPAPGGAPPATDPLWTTTCVYAHLTTLGTDALIRDCVTPLAQDLVSRGDATGWFFLRYWHGGPHVRVRFRDPEPTAVAAFETAVAAWLEEHAGDRVDLDPARFHARFSQQDPAPWHEHGQIVREAYLPEVDRYGGPEALARCEEFFELSSRIAGAVLRTGDRTRIFAVGLDLMTLAMGAASPAALDAARSARRYFASWDFVDEASSDRDGALQQAEGLRRDWSQVWDKRVAAVTAAVRDSPGSTHGLWRRGIEDLLADLDRISGRGGLTRPPAAILWSLIHMMNNRLGISVHEERVLSWLASAMTLGWTSVADYFEDTPHALDRAYLEGSKYAVRTHAAAQWPRPPSAATGQERPDGFPAVPLPDPAPLRHRLDAVLEERRSAYGDYGGTLDRQVLATVLGWAAGPVQSRAVQWGDTRIVPRTHPSPGGRYATSVLVNAWQVTGIDPGLYAYAADRHALVRLGPALTRSTVQHASPTFGTAEDGAAGGPPVVLTDTVPAVLLLASDITALRPKYGLRALRLLLQECGHLAQNLLLCATAAGCRSIPVSAFSDDELSTAVHLDGIDGFVSALLPLGPESG